MSDHTCKSLCLNTQLWAQREVSQSSKGIHNEAAPCSSALYSYRNCDNNLEGHQCILHYRSMMFWRGKKATKNPSPLKVLQMETPFVFLSSFMNFQDNKFSIKVIYSFDIINKIQEDSGKFFERSSQGVIAWRNCRHFLTKTMRE